MIATVLDIMDIKSTYSQPIDIADLPPINNIRRSSQSSYRMKHQSPQSQSRKENYSHKAIQGINERIIGSKKQSARVDTAADLNQRKQQQHLFFTQKQTTQRKPIFSAQKIESSNIKFVLPELHQYTPQVKPKPQLRSMMSGKQSLDMPSFNNDEQITNTNNLEQRDETVFSIPQMFQSTIRTNTFVQPHQKQSQQQQQHTSLSFPILGLLGILIAYCIYVSFR